MASEPADESVSVSLPPDLAEWVDERAATRDTDRETVLVQLLAAHRATEDIEDGTESTVDALTNSSDVESEVRNIIAERASDIAGLVANEIDIEAQVSAAVDEQLSDTVESQLRTALDERLANEIDNKLVDSLDERLADVSQSAAEQATTQVEDHVESLESDFMANVEDVRDRVIQVKKEADRKAPAEHSHPNLAGQINEISADVADVQEELTAVRADLEGQFDSHESRFDELDETVWDVQEKLQTIAHVVKKLRDSSQFDNKRDTSVDQIKQTAAQQDIDRAMCEACGDGVEIALMTAPECPHCQATVTDVDPGDGFFGKPKLVKAQGIEPAGDDDDS